MSFRKIGLTLFAWLACVASPARAADGTWSHESLSALKRWVAAAPEDALPVLSAASLDRAMVGADQERIDQEASDLALDLARMHLLGRASTAEKSGWQIDDTDRSIELAPLLEEAVGNSIVDTFFASLRPRHPDYSLLREALATETDIDRRESISRSMERWRWMPRSLGPDYVLVNVAAFEARLWRDSRQVGTWPVIVGKTSTPTPVFSATISGVTFNPWWEIPASIVRESVGALVRRNPAAARARGYVWGGGRYRQRPGPNNALGQMKLVMPNRFSVYMHDTPNKDLFNQEVRAFSHGCIRTSDAVGYAATLLEGIRTRAQVDAIVASGKTTTIELEQAIPIYVAYFTATADGAGGVKVMPDIYGRDRRLLAVIEAGGACKA